MIDRELIEPRVIACKWCRARIVCDDAAQTIAHESPECEGFRAFLAAAADRGIRAATTRAVLLDERGRELAHQGKPS